jgi:hypothetical protein
MCKEITQKEGKKDANRAKLGVGKTLFILEKLLIS